METVRDNHIELGKSVWFATPRHRQHDACLQRYLIVPSVLACTWQFPRLVGKIRFQERLVNLQYSIMCSYLIPMSGRESNGSFLRDPATRNRLGVIASS
jgi:hypothetical protein